MLMRTAFHRLSLLLFLGLSQHTVQANKDCKCVFGDPCWPSDAEFEKLAAQVSQPLVRPLPPASPCYVSGTNSTECAEVTTKWTDGRWRADHPGAMQSPQFETFTFPNGTIEACYVDTSLGVPCGQGSVSAIGVDARSPSDIAAALAFASEHNLPLVVKNTG